MCSFKEVQNFSMQSFPQYKVCLSSMFYLQNFDFEYPKGICSPHFDVEEFSGLFAHSSIFLIKDSLSLSDSLSICIIPYNNVNHFFTAR